MNDNNLTTFPHSNLSAAKTARAGVLTINDLIHEDTYGIMTRDDATESVMHVNAIYSLDTDTSRLLERARTVNVLDALGNTHLDIALCKTNGISSTMDTVLKADTDTCKICNASSSATFDSTGLFWDSDNCCLYIGGNKQFRLRCIDSDPDNNGHSSLLTEFKCADGSYKIKDQLVAEV